MRDVDRINTVLEYLKVFWHKYPDMRLCQLLHLIASRSGWKNNDLYYLEDDVVLKYIKTELP